MELPTFFPIDAAAQADITPSSPKRPEGVNPDFFSLLILLLSPSTPAKSELSNSGITSEETSPSTLLDPSERLLALPQAGNPTEGQTPTAGTYGPSILVDEEKQTQLKVPLQSIFSSAIVPSPKDPSFSIGGVGGFSDTTGPTVTPSGLTLPQPSGDPAQIALLAKTQMEGVQSLPPVFIREGLSIQSPAEEGESNKSPEPKLTAPLASRSPGAIPPNHPFLPSVESEGIPGAPPPKVTPSGVTVLRSPLPSQGDPARVGVFTEEQGVKVTPSGVTVLRSPLPSQGDTAGVGVLSEGPTESVRSAPPAFFQEGENTQNNQSIQGSVSKSTTYSPIPSAGDGVQNHPSPFGSGGEDPNQGSQKGTPDGSLQLVLGNKIGNPSAVSFQKGLELEMGSASVGQEGVAGAYDLARSESTPEISAPRTSGTWHSVINQVANEISTHINQNRHEALIRLEPPELGKLKIEILVEGDKVQTRIITEMSEVKSLIQTHLSDLKQALQTQSLDLTGVRVDVSGSGEDAEDMLQGFQQESGEDDGQRDTSSDSQTMEENQGERSETGQPDQAKGVSVWA